MACGPCERARRQFFNGVRHGDVQQSAMALKQAAAINAQKLREKRIEWMRQQLERRINAFRS